MNVVSEYEFAMPAAGVEKFPDQSRNCKEFHGSLERNPCFPVDALLVVISDVTISASVTVVKYCVSK